YERFQPLWRELRKTQILPPQVFALADDTAFLLQQNAVGVGKTPGGWPIYEYMGANLHVAMADHAYWQHGKLLLAAGEYVETLKRETLDQIVDYVAAGGNLYMRADTGRYCLEEPDADWW